MLQILWNYLAYAGVAGLKQSAEQKHVVLINGLCLSIILFSLLNLILSAVFVGVHPYQFIVLGYAFLLPLTIVLNQKQRYLTARLYFTVLSLSALICGAVLFGYQSQFYLFIGTVILLSFFLYPDREQVWPYLIAASGIAALIYILIEQPPPASGFPLEFLALQGKITTASFFFLLTVFAVYIRKSFLITERYLEAERHKSEKLLRNILPAKVIQQLRENPDSIAERFEDCTVLFSDIVGFSELSRKLSAVEVVRLLNELFSAFDDLAEKHGLEKIKTIGDAYMAVGGLPDPDPYHAERTARFAIDLLTVISDYRRQNDHALEIRIGIASGAAVAGVIGKKKFIYDLWGDSVNTASRMESHGLPGQIQVTENTYALLKDKFLFKERGSIEVKGMGHIRSYLLEGPAS